MPSVESFELDHDAVEAPYVRHCGQHEGDINKYDVRITQPNEQFMDPAAIHSLEHLLAFGVRAEVKKLGFDMEIIDMSPMGCQTGFYLIVRGTPTIEEVIQAVVGAMQSVVDADVVPATERKKCGQYTLHNLDEAKVHARHFVGHSIDDLRRVFKETEAV